MTTELNAKADCERLMNDALPFGEKMLREFGEFHPYGGYIDGKGALVRAGAVNPETEWPRGSALVELLRESMRKLAREGGCQAVAIVCNVSVRVPKLNAKSDAIEIDLDHNSGYSVQVFFPYTLIGGEVVYGESFAQRGDGAIFPAK